MSDAKHRPGKRPFQIGVAMRRLRKAVASYPKAALFELYGEGHTSAFEILGRMARLSDAPVARGRA